jgi:trehalose-6-phosphatase
VPIGHDKGVALRRALERFRPETAFYFGDSPGDEAAFRELGSTDFPVRVGRGATRALYRVGDLRGVTKFLNAVVRLRGSEPGLKEVS